jgi:hypothetical protein
MPEARSCVGRVTKGMGQPARGGIRSGRGILRYFQADSFGKRLNQKSRMKRERAPRDAVLNPWRSQEEPGGTFLGHRVYLKAKAGGDNSMPEKRGTARRRQRRRPARPA